MVKVVMPHAFFMPQTNVDIKKRNFSAPLSQFNLNLNYEKSNVCDKVATFFLNRKEKS